MKKPDDRPRGYHGHFASTKKKIPVQTMMDLDTGIETEVISLKDCDEIVGEKIKEYLQDNAEILPEETPKDILYITDWFFNNGIKILFMIFLYVAIWYVGVRI